MSNQNSSQNPNPRAPSPNRSSETRRRSDSPPSSAEPFPGEASRRAAETQPGPAGQQSLAGSGQPISGDDAPPADNRLSRGNPSRRADEDADQEEEGQVV